MADQNQLTGSSQIKENSIPEECLTINNTPASGYYLKWNGLTMEWSTVSGTGGTLDHNLLINLQGGQVDEYYHLTSVEYGKLHDPMTVSDSASINFTQAEQMISGVVIASGVDHNQLSNLTTGDPHIQYLLDSTWNNIDRCGFVLDSSHNQKTSLSFNDSTYTFTLADLGAGWEYFRAGILYSITGNKTVQIGGGSPVNNTLYYIYIDATDGTLTSSTSAWTLNDTKIPVTTIYWNATLSPKYSMTDERHTCLIDRRIHRYEHITAGTKFISGAVLSGYTLSGSTDAENTFGIGEAIIADEDLFITISGLSDPNGSTNAYYVTNRSSGAWIWTQSPVPFLYTVSGYIQYDNSGTMAQGTTSKYYNTYLGLCNIQGSMRHVLVHGRSEFANAAAAYAENIGAFGFTNFINNETVWIYQLTWETNASYTTKGKCRLNRVQAITANVTVVSSSLDHNSLSGLQGGVVGSYYHLPSGAAGAMVFQGVSAPEWSAAADLVWDNTNKRLGIGGAPSYPLHVATSLDSIAVFANNLLANGTAIAGLGDGIGVNGAGKIHGVMGTGIGSGTGVLGVSGSGIGGHFKGSSGACLRLTYNDLGATYYTDFFVSPTGHLGIIPVGNAGIGTTAPDRKVEINDIDGNCLRLTYNDANGSAANYADLLVTSAGYLQLNPSGSRVGINTSPNYPLEISAAFAGSAQYNKNTITVNSSGTTYAIAAGWFETDVTNTDAAAGSTFNGIVATLRYRGTKGFDSSGDRGVNGIYLSVFNYNTGNPTDWISGFYTDIRNVGTGGSFGNVTNMAVYRATAPAIDGGTVTNLYGLYLANMTGATNNYGIYSLGGINYLAGNTGIGLSAPLSVLHVKSADPIIYVQDSSTTGGDTYAGIMFGNTQSGGVFTETARIVMDDTGTPTWLDITTAVDSRSLVLQRNGGNVGINTTNTSLAKVSILSGADVTTLLLSDVLTDNAIKVSRIATPTYDSDDTPSALIVGTNTSTYNDVRVGGGSAILNAATAIRFYAAADLTTTFGTEIVAITPDGLGINVATPQATLHVAGGSILIGGDDGGYASTIGFTNVSNTSVSSGTGTIKMGGATNRNSTGFIKIYIGTSAYYIPVFTTITG